MRTHFLPYPKLENLFFLWIVVQTNFLIKITVQKTNILLASAFIAIHAGDEGEAFLYMSPITRAQQQ